MAKIIYTKNFNSNFRNLRETNANVAANVRQAINEASKNGCISSFPRSPSTKTPISGIEVYEISNDHRLIVGLSDKGDDTWAFLFVGNNPDADRWLDAHRNYRWVKIPGENSFLYILVTKNGDLFIPADRFRYSNSESENDALLLKNLLNENDMVKLGISPEDQKFLLSIKVSDFDERADHLIEKLIERLGSDKALYLYDLMWHAHEQEWDELNLRKKILPGDESNLENRGLSELETQNNTDSIITFDDHNILEEMLKRNNYADWMLFVHPAQKDIFEKDFRGPAKLSGVSGSGKTSVLLHRARRLAKKYVKPVLLVTLTESTRKLLDILLDELCVAERSLIETKTMAMLAKEVFSTAYQHLPGAMISSEQQSEVIKEIAENLCRNQTGEESAFVSYDATEMKNFLVAEISYVRGRLAECDFETYLDPKLFQRSGRGVPLGKVDREIILSAIRKYTEYLRNNSLYDYDMLISEIIKSPINYNKYRCILVDEVQDLSELDIKLIGSLNSPSLGEGQIANIENGLFLTGDGAQSIYKRGFSLRRIGIDVIGRSYILKKNYRNTFEILNAAFALIQTYEYLTIGEDNTARPLEPDFATRHKNPPQIVRCSSLEEEAKMVAGKIASLLAMTMCPGQICVIGASTKAREEISRELGLRGISYVELRDDADNDGKDVKISTIESAKGHEFTTVFIMGLNDYVLPRRGTQNDDISKEASRLYVAMTRAKENLIMSYNESPSPFLAVIQKNCEEFIMRDGTPQKVD